MTTLPEQAHTGAEVATRQADDPYALDASMITLPQLLFGQYQSKAFKARKVEYGDVFVGLGAADPKPNIIAKGGDPLGEPVRFYVHQVRTAFDIQVDPDDKKSKRGIRIGSTYGDALAQVDGDPTRVWQKFVYRLTLPDYPTLPVVFWAGGLTAKAARWVNSQIGIARQEGKSNEEIRQIAFQVQTKPQSNKNGDFVVGEFGFANVKAAQAEKDHALIEAHADTLASTPVVEAQYEEVEVVAPDTSKAPALG